MRPPPGRKMLDAISCGRRACVLRARAWDFGLAVAVIANVCRAPRACNRTYPARATHFTLRVQHDGATRAGQPRHVEDLPAFSRTRGFNVAIALCYSPRFWRTDLRPGR